MKKTLDLPNVSSDNGCLNGFNTCKGFICNSHNLIFFTINSYGICNYDFLSLFIYYGNYFYRCLLCAYQLITASFFMVEYCRYSANGRRKTSQPPL